MKSFKKELDIICDGEMELKEMKLKVFDMNWGKEEDIEIEIYGVNSSVKGRKVFFEKKYNGGNKGGKVVEGFVVKIKSGINISKIEGVNGKDGIGYLKDDEDLFEEEKYLKLEINREKEMEFLKKFDSDGVELVIKNEVWN